MKRIPHIEYQTVQEYSRAQQISIELVRRCCRTGRLPAKKVNGRWLIPRDTPITGYEPRLKHGRYVGWKDIVRGDLEAFLRKKGIKVTET